MPSGWPQVTAAISQAASHVSVALAKKGPTGVARITAPQPVKLLAGRAMVPRPPTSSADRKVLPGAIRRCRDHAQASGTRSLELRLRRQDLRLPLVAASFALHAVAGSRHDYMSRTKSLRTHQAPRCPTPEFADSEREARSTDCRGSARRSHDSVVLPPDAAPHAGRWA